MKFNKDSRKAFLDTVLGDGYVDKHGCLVIKHCIAQEDYLLWKRKYLVSNGVKCSVIRYTDYDGYPSCHIRTPNLPYGKLVRKFLYEGSYKNYFTPRILGKMDEVGLAIFYMDDGCLSQKKDKQGKLKGNEIILSTYTTKENNQVFIDYLKSRWDLNFSQVKSKGKYRLRCGTKEARKFVKIIESYVSQVPSMAHKLNVKPEKI